MTAIARFCRFERNQGTGLQVLGIVLICAGLILCSGASGQPSGAAVADKESIVKLENEWLNALNNADVDQIARILADDFVRPAPRSGLFIDKTTLLQYYRSQLSKRDAATARTMKITSVDVYGQVAIARGIVVVPDPKHHNESRLLFTDVFVYRSGTWKAVSAQENAIGTGG